MSADIPEFEVWFDRMKKRYAYLDGNDRDLMLWAWQAALKRKPDSVFEGVMIKNEEITDEWNEWFGKLAIKNDDRIRLDFYLKRDGEQ